MKKFIFTVFALCALRPIMAMHEQVYGALSPAGQSCAHLKKAAKDGNFQLLKAIISHAPIDRTYQREDFISHALIYSAQEGQIELFKHLLSHYPEAIHLVKKSDCLWYASSSGNLPMVKLAFESGAPIDGNSLFCKPIVEASRQGLSEIVQYLIEQGANVRPEAPNKLALSEALKNNHFDTAQTVLATIPKSEREKLENVVRGIIAGLIAVKRGNPALPKDIRKIIAQKVITPLVDEHIAYANQLISEINDPSILAKAEMLIMQWQALRKEVESNIRHILFSNYCSTTRKIEDVD